MLLADVFLDRLEAGYQLVPRGRRAAEPARPALNPSGLSFSRPRVWPIALLAPGPVSAERLLATSVFVVARPPVFPLVVLVFLAWRFRAWGPRRRRYL